jgi:hypothetical protein
VVKDLPSKRQASRSAQAPPLSCLRAQEPLPLMRWLLLGTHLSPCPMIALCPTPLSLPSFTLSLLVFFEGLWAGTLLGNSLVALGSLVALMHHTWLELIALPTTMGHLSCFFMIFTVFSACLILCLCLVPSPDEFLLIAWTSPWRV